MGASDESVEDDLQLLEDVLGQQWMEPVTSQQLEVVGKLAPDERRLVLEVNDDGLAVVLLTCTRN
jgi:hypothetical protein